MLQSTTVEPGAPMAAGSARAAPTSTLAGSGMSLPGRRARSAQVAAAAAVALVAAAVVYGLYASLAGRGYRFEFGFLARQAGIEISEGMTLDWTNELTLDAFKSTDTNAQALATGLFNTVKVSVVGIVISTLLGVGIAIGRTSTNWLLRQLCFLYVETVRNTPLLIQLVAWYFAVILKLPLITSAAKVYGVLIASRQGLVLPALNLQTTSAAAALGFSAAVLLAYSLAALPTRDRIGPDVCLAPARAAVRRGFDARASHEGNIGMNSSRVVVGIHGLHRRYGSHEVVTHEMGFAREVADRVVYVARSQALSDPHATRGCQSKAGRPGLPRSCDDCLDARHAAATLCRGCPPARPRRR